MRFGHCSPRAGGQERKYSRGTFSFTRQRPLPGLQWQRLRSMSRCSFLDVYLRCPTGDGRRYRDEVLDIRREGCRTAAAAASATCWISR